jgi:mRNA interferase MazF
VAEDSEIISWSSISFGHFFICPFFAIVHVMLKDFDTWNGLKKLLESKPLIFCNPREIWWCSLGVNVGAETSGKNELFERPVIVLGIYNQQSILIAPFTSKEKKDTYHVPVTFNGTTSWAVLSHARTISPKRLQRKLTRIDEAQFEQVMLGLSAVIKISTGYELPRNKAAPVLTGASEPEGLMRQLYTFDHLSQEDVEVLGIISKYSNLNQTNDIK